MTVTETASSLVQLQKEQERVQLEKFQGRQLREYNSHLFPGQIWREPRSAAISELLVDGLPVDGNSIEGLLYGMYVARKEEVVHWADMGGGRGLSMRQLLAAPGVSAALRATNVDLFDYDLNGLDSGEIEYLEGLGRGVIDAAAKPEVVIADVETVVLPVEPDLVTSIEVVQYLNDPLRSIANWYNQLAVGGLMVVSSEHDIASWIRYDKAHPTQRIWSEDRPTPTAKLIEELGRCGIEHAITKSADGKNGQRIYDPNDFTALALRKKADTTLQVNAPVTEVWVNPWDYKAVYYEFDEHPVEVVSH